MAITPICNLPLGKKDPEHLVREMTSSFFNAMAGETRNFVKVNKLGEHESLIEGLVLRHAVLERIGERVGSSIDRSDVKIGSRSFDLFKD